MWTTTVDMATSSAPAFNEGLHYAGGRLDERGPGEWQQDRVWSFALTWWRLNGFQTSGRGTISDTWHEWEQTGRVTYSVGGRPRWIAVESRDGTMGVCTRAMPADIGAGDVLVVPTPVPGGSVPSFIAVDTVAHTVAHGGRSLLVAHGTVITRPVSVSASGRDVTLATVDMAPSEPVEVTTRGTALDRVWR